MASDTVLDQGITLLAAAFDKRLDPTRKKIYIELLKDLPDEVYRAAVKHVAATSTFFPSPGEIRSAAAFLGKLAYNIPPADVAWGELVNHAHAPRQQRVYCAEYIALSEQASHPEDTQTYWHLVYAMKDHEAACQDCHIITTEYQFSHPLIQEVAARLGWPVNFWSDNIGVDRGRFIKTYEAELERLTQKSILLPAVREFVESDQDLLMDDRRSAFDTGERKQINEQYRRLARGLEA
jgi:hypothetical protein